MIANAWYVCHLPSDCLSEWDVSGQFFMTQRHTQSQTTSSLNVFLTKMGLSETIRCSRWCLGLARGSVLDVTLSKLQFSSLPPPFFLSSMWRMQRTRMVTIFLSRSRLLLIPGSSCKSIFSPINCLLKPRIALLSHPDKFECSILPRDKAAEDLISSNALSWNLKDRLFSDPCPALEFDVI